MSLINIDRLRSYADHGLNVLLEGHAGVGKSSAILESFGTLKYKYFSAPTLDPWVDLIGAPRSVMSEKHGQEVLRLVPPEWVLDDDVEIIFFDELNRAPEKVLDAVMELIQFKSINGRKFSKLRAVWAAINPADDSGDYKVEELDRALRDRFQVQIRIPFQVDEEWFCAKYPENGKIFCSWWATLTTDVKNLVSPRRLDYVAEAYAKGLPLSDFLPAEAPIAKLRAALRMLPFHQQMDEISTDEEAREFLKKVNNSTKLLELVELKDKQAIAFFKMYKHVMPQELVEALAPRTKMVEAGEEIIVSFEGLLKQVNGLKVKANAEPAELRPVFEMINAAEFQLFFKNGGSLQQSMRSCIRTKPVGFDALVRHLRLMYTKGTAQLMKDASFTGDQRSNFMQCLLALISADTDKYTLDPKERKKMSDHMYLHKITPAKWA